MKLRLAASFLLPLLCVISALGAQVRGESGGFPEKRGDEAAAEQYCQWAEGMIGEGRWNEALAGLERASDFSSVSSDLSLLLARARSHEKKSRGAVLRALAQAVETGRWTHYRPSHARLLEAEQLIAMRNYSGALASLALTPESADSAVLRLLALKGLSSGERAAPHALVEFRRFLPLAMDRFPRDPRPLAVFFAYARNRKPAAGDHELLELVLRRLPFVLESDPELAWMAAPFIRDTAEARRLVSACRAGGLTEGAKSGGFRPNPASIPAALNLGLISGGEAAAELFSPNGELILGKNIIVETGALLRDEGERNLFAEKLLAFSGTITGDEDGDGYDESSALYREGVLQGYLYDLNQDGIAELDVSFDSGGVPLAAKLAAPGDGEAGRGSDFSLPLKDEDMRIIKINWEPGHYPAVVNAELDHVGYIPRPGEFLFAPLVFTELGGSGKYSGLMYPAAEKSRLRLSPRALAASSVLIKRPGGGFEGAEEWIDLDRGIPLRAKELLNGRLVSETEFERGLPVIQRLDLDLDSRLETIRRFRVPPPGREDMLDYQNLAASSESDWDGDGVYETGELYLEDGSVVYSWDMDGDGVREYSETKTGNGK